MAGVVSAGLRRWPLSGWLRAGVRCLYDLGGNSAGKRAQVLTFSPCLLSLSPSLLLWMSSRSPAGSVCLIWVGWRHRGGGWRRVRLAGVLGVSCVSCGRRQGWPLSCRVCCPSPLLAVLGQSVRALGIGGDLRPTGLLISKMHKDSIRNAA